MNRVQVHTNISPKQIEPVRQLEPEPTRQPEQGPVQTGGAAGCLSAPPGQSEWIEAGGVAGVAAHGGESAGAADGGAPR